MKIVRRDNPERSVYSYSPFRSVFDDFFRFPTVDEFLSPVSMRGVYADVWEQDESVFVKMAMPGVDQKDIKIEVTGDTISISAKRKEESKDEDKKKYLYRSMESSYQQTFTLPTTVDADGAKASFENGVVTVQLPKSKEARTKTVEIK